jgi:hypothetical protein
MTQGIGVRAILLILGNYVSLIVNLVLEVNTWLARILRFFKS